MKKILVLLLVSLFMLSCANSSTDTDNATSAATMTQAEMDASLKAALESNMRARGVEVTATVERVRALDNSSFYFYKVSLADAANGLAAQDQFVFYDGKYMVQDFTNVETTTSMAKDILFDYQTYDNIDTSKLSLVYGKADAKNVIIEVTDYECPYCRRAYAYLETKLAERNDVAIYIAHLPLVKIHQNAEPAARILEAGLIMGKNFEKDLFTDEMVVEGTPEALITAYAKKSGDEKRFRQLMYSAEVTARITDGLALADELGFRSTPSFIINGKRIEGFDTQYIDRALGF
jgi:protein-disulfide isomerase